MVNRILIIAFGCVLVLAGVARPQEVVITGFPLGQGSNVDSSFFNPYHSQLQDIADTLLRHPLAQAIVIGGADGQRYRHNDDAQNPALALGRAHALRNLLVEKFNVDSNRIIIQSESVKNRGKRFRYASVRIEKNLADFQSNLDRLAAKLDTVANRPPVEQHITEVTKIVEDPSGNMGLRFGAGISSSSFGVIPIVTAAVAWESTVYLELVAGHTFWNSSFPFESEDLDARRRLIGGQLIVYPFENRPIGILGGWMRVEEISQEYYRYGNMTEGPVIGLRVSPHEYLSVTGAYNPARYHAAGDSGGRTKHDQFIVSIGFHIDFGSTR